MLDWHLGMIETELGEPTPLNGADALTLARAWLVPAVAASPDPGLLILGGLTDIADGRVARATRCTRFGRDLEGTVDACFGVAALRGAVRTQTLSRLPVRIEQARLTAGALYICGAYFGAAQAPDRTVIHSARSAAPVRFAALIAAAVGHRRLADALLLASTALAARALVAPR
jgi:phosphatidylglycerophosphate synthase